MQLVWFIMPRYLFISSHPLHTLLEQHLSELLCATAPSRLVASQGAEIFTESTMLNNSQSIAQENYLLLSQYPLMIVPFDHSGSSVRRDISQIQIARIRMTASNPSSAFPKESTEDGGDEGYNPGGLVISGSPTNAPSPAVQSLPLCICKPVAVIQGSHVGALLPQLLPLLLARSSSLQWLPLLRYSPLGSTLPQL